MNQKKRLTLAEVQKLYLTPSRLRHKPDVDRALAMLIRCLLDAKKKKRHAHRVGEVWRHEDEASGMIVYHPMHIVKIVGHVFVMSDGERWTASELRESGWSPQNGAKR